MEILKTAKKVSKWYGITPNSEQNLPPMFRKYASTIHISLIGGSFLLYIASLVHFCIIETKSTAAFFFSALFVAVAVMRTTLYFLILLIKSELFVLIDDLEDVINERSRELETRRIHFGLINKSETFWKKFFKYVLIFGISFPCVKILESYYGFYLLHTGSLSFRPFLPTTLPFDWKTPGTYLLAVCIQMFWIVSGLAVTLDIILFFSGICDVLGAFCIDINKKSTDLNNMVVSKTDRTFTPSDRINIANEFYAIIEFHSKAKQFAARFSATFSYVLTAFFALSTPCICTALLNLNLVVDSGHFLDVLRFGVFLSVVMLYFICLCMIGDQVTTRFDEVDASIWQCSLHEFPIEIQKHMPMIMAIMQKPVYIEGFMNVRCTREVLKAIMNASYSYFSVLRGMSQ